MKPADRRRARTSMTTTPAAAISQMKMAGSAILGHSSVRLRRPADGDTTVAYLAAYENVQNQNLSKTPAHASSAHVTANGIAAQPANAAHLGSATRASNGRPRTSRQT